MAEVKLSILICTLKKRSECLNKLTVDISIQVFKACANDKVQVIVHEGYQSVGEKRNALIENSTGEYICFHDDDDPLQPGYIEELLKACEQGPDAVGFKGWMTTNGAKRVDFHISKNNPYQAASWDGKEVYLRWNNHLTPIKRSIAQQFKFPDVNYGEDYEWSKAIHDSGLIKTEVFIDKYLYHYDFRTGGNKL